jgi:hypothetical protein
VCRPQAHPERTRIRDAVMTAALSHLATFRTTTTGGGNRPRRAGENAVNWRAMQRRGTERSMHRRGTQDLQAPTGKRAQSSARSCTPARWRLAVGMDIDQASTGQEIRHVFEDEMRPRPFPTREFVARLARLPLSSKRSQRTGRGEVPGGSVGSTCFHHHSSWLSHSALMILPLSQRSWAKGSVFVDCGIATARRV